MKTLLYASLSLAIAYYSNLAALWALAIQGYAGIISGLP